MHCPVSLFAIALMVGLEMLAATGRRVGAADVPLVEGTEVHFATREEAAELLGRSDEFLEALSLFDLQVRLGTREGATRERLQAFLREQADEWTAAEQETLSAALALLAEKLAPFRLPLPPKVLLVKTTGRDEGQAAYCRGPAIMLPRRMVSQAAPQLARLLNHELFHVVSNQNPELRAKLYGLIGFQVCPDVPLTAELAARKITNPDAPRVNCQIELEWQGRTIHAAPLLVARSDYDPAAAGTLFAYLQFRLLVVEQRGEIWHPALKSGQPQLIEAQQIAAYAARIGRNTGYVIHPDEILADNFVHLVQQTPQLATPELVERLGEALRH